MFARLRGSAFELGCDTVEMPEGAGLAQMEITIQNTYSGHALQQVWDELRRRISDMRGDLPPGGWSEGALPGCRFFQVSKCKHSNKTPE